MLLERGIVVSFETIRRWGLKFGPDYARRLRRKRPGPNDIWHLDEVVISIAGKKHWLWRAVDQDGYVLDEIVQNRRNTKAAKRSPGSLQRFISIFSALRNLFVPPRSKRSALAIHIHRLQAMAEWEAAVGKLA
jgi:hypothetical protein